MVLPRSWRRLHAPAVWDDPDEAMNVEDGRTVCGITGRLMIPGVLSRMGLPRCAHCCRMTGMPPGKGSPKNSKECRPLVERRIAALPAC